MQCRRQQSESERTEVEARFITNMIQQAETRSGRVCTLYGLSSPVPPVSGLFHDVHTCAIAD
eukprot:1701689-Prymnesium_polylepis.2